MLYLIKKFIAKLKNCFILNYVAVSLITIIIQECIDITWL